MSGRPLVLWTQAYKGLGKKVTDSGGFEAGEVETRTFPDGERYHRIATSVAGRDVVVLGGTVSDEDTLEIYDLGCAVAKYSARSLTMVLPYFGYSTMERAVRPGEVVKAKTRARLLSAVPPAAVGNRVMLLDLHTDGITHYFEAAVTPVHVYAQPVIKRAARRLGGDDFVLASTDAGRAKWVESLANAMKVPAAVMLKRRLDGDRVELVAMAASVEGRRVVIYDDMIRTGGSLLQAAQAYLDAGASAVCALATHGVFPGEAFQRIADSGLIERVVVTDSHPQVLRLRHPTLEVETVADLLADQIGGGMP